MNLRPKTINVKLWHSPMNGGWIWFDKTQYRRVSGGFGIKETDHLGDPCIDPVLWWCLFGFCGHIVIQSWPWEKNPEKQYREGE